MLYTDSKTVTSSKHNYTYTVTMNVCDDNVGCNEVKNVMCYTTIPTLFVYFFYDHIPTFFYIFSEMFFITCIYTSNKKHFMKNVKECRDVIVKKVLEQGWDTRTTSSFILLLFFLLFLLQEGPTTIA